MNRLLPLCVSLTLLFSCSSNSDTITCGVGKCDAFDVSGCVGPACDRLDETQFDFIVIGSGAGGGTVSAPVPTNNLLTNASYCPS